MELAFDTLGSALDNFEIEWKRDRPISPAARNIVCDMNVRDVYDVCSQITLAIRKINNIVSRRVIRSIKRRHF